MSSNIYSFSSAFFCSVNACWQIYLWSFFCVTNFRFRFGVSFCELAQRIKNEIYLLFVSLVSHFFRSIEDIADGSTLKIYYLCRRFVYSIITNIANFVNCLKVCARFDEKSQAKFWKMDSRMQFVLLDSSITMELLWNLNIIIFNLKDENLFR